MLHLVFGMHVMQSLYSGEKFKKIAYRVQQSCKTSGILAVVQLLNNELKKVGKDARKIDFL